jgi:hypothetical protein
MSRRVEMVNVRNVIHMYETSKLSLRDLSQACSCSRTAVTAIVNVVKLNNLTFDKVKLMTDQELNSLIYPEKLIKKNDKPNLDLEYLAKELKKPHVTRMTLWREHIENNPNGYKRTQFFEILNDYLSCQNVTMHVNKKPGEKMYVDWAGDVIHIFDNTTGEQIKAYMFVSCVGCSSYPYVEAFLTKEKANYIQAHINAFNYYNAIPIILVPDNDKSAVISANKYEPILNESYKKMAEYYGIGIIPARVRTPKDKPSVEKAVLDAAEREIIGGLRNETFFSLFELNKRIKEKLKEFSQRPFQKKSGSRFSVFQEYDLPNMRPLPDIPFEFAEFKIATVNIDYHIEVDKNFYSVPYIYVKKKVNVAIYPNTIQIHFNNERIATHQRITKYQYKYSTDPNHMPEDHKNYNNFSKQYFIDWALKISEETKEIMSSVFEHRNVEEQGYRNGLGIQRLYREFGDLRFKNACKLICNKNLSKSYVSLKKIIESNSLPEVNEKIIKHDNIRGKEYYS